jgi:hypothetical protein
MESKEEINISGPWCNLWTKDYDVLEDKGNGYIVIKLHEPFEYHPDVEPCDTFLGKKPKQR